MERAVAFDRWEYQWVRALRWHERTLDVTGRETGKGSLDAADFSEALVQAVWHLRDWLDNDPRTALPSNEIKACTVGDPALQLVADVANGGLDHRELADIAWDGLVAWRRWLEAIGLEIPDIPELPSH